MEAYTPQQTMELISRIGYKKANMHIGKTIVNSILAGPLLGFGAAITLSTNASPWYQENAPGLIHTVAAAFFPIGLILVVLTGADLFTSNVMFLPVAYLNRRCTLLDIAKSWVISFFGNLGGMLFFCLVICGYGGVFDNEVFAEEAVKLAVSKAYTPTWYGIFLKAIGANWLVCLAVFMSISSREIVSKILAIWWPITTFVALGMDHVIANMFLVPIGIFHGAPFGVGYYIWKSMIPAFLGNTIGGGLFVGVVYWYLFMTGDEAVDPDFDKPGAMHSGASSEVYQNAGPVRNTEKHEADARIV